MNKQSIVYNTDIPLVVFLGELVFILLNIVPVYEYDTENNKTDKVIGFSYIVVNTETFDKYSVKVLGSKPLLKSDELATRRENGEKVFVEFDNATVRVYWSSFKKSYADSFKADGISIVETAN